MPIIRYDSNGNISSLQRYGNSQSMMDNLSYSYTAGTNRLASITNSVGSATQTYTYDANGNATSDSYRGIGFIVYDINNLPITVYKTSGATLQYYYDATGNRIQKYDGSANTWYVLGADGKTEVITTAATTAPTYTMDNLGQILRNGTTLTRYYYLKDHLGSIKMMVDASGNVQSYDDYYPYGMTMPGRSGTMGADTRFRFTGKERDVESGFDYFGARYYDSRIARWMSVDPLAGKYPEIAPYVYTHDDPLNRFDLDGRADWKAIKRGLLMVGTGSISTITSGVAMSASEGVLAPLLWSTFFMSGLGSIAWGSATIVAGSVDQTKVLEEGLIRQILLGMGASREVQAKIALGIASGNFLIDLIAPEVGLIKLIEWLDKISTAIELDDATREYARVLLEEAKEKKAEEKREELEKLLRLHKLSDKK